MALADGVVVGEVTRIVNQEAHLSSAAANELLPLVYGELRRLAGRKLQREAAGHTLQPTALVHEAYMRLVGPDDRPEWENPGHFFAASAEAMRHILVESARRRRSLKRGGGQARLVLSEGDAIVESANVDGILDLDAAFSKLSECEPEIAKLVNLRDFVGLSIEESAETLGISRRTGVRNWAFARAWLGRELTSEARG